VKNLFQNRPSVLTLAITILACLFLADSVTLSKMARFTPQATLAVTLLLLILRLLTEFRSDQPINGSAEESEKTGKNSAKPDIDGITTAKIILRIGAILPMVWLFGMSAGASIFCLAYLRWQSEESWKFSIISSCALGMILYWGFKHSLHISLYPGIAMRLLTSP